MTSSKQTKKTRGIHKGSIHVLTRLIAAFVVFVVAPCVFFAVETRATRQQVLLRSWPKRFSVVDHGLIIIANLQMDGGNVAENDCNIAMIGAQQSSVDAHTLMETLNCEFMQFHLEKNRSYRVQRRGSIQIIVWSPNASRRIRRASWYTSRALL